VHGEPPIALESACRHGISGPDMLHAWAFATDVFELSEEMVLYVGPDRAGNMLEVGVVEWHEDWAIAHAMRARPRFLR
jgi:hypothetical protein